MQDIDAPLMHVKNADPSLKHVLHPHQGPAAKVVHAKQISVKGIALGDSLETVIEKVGYPDGQQQYGDNIINVEYGNRFGLEKTGIILHLRDDKVTKITLKEPFNEFLKGETKIEHTKTSIFNLLGTPAEVRKVPIADGSALLVSIYTYPERGIEVLVRKQQQNALILVA